MRISLTNYSNISHRTHMQQISLYFINERLAHLDTMRSLNGGVSIILRGFICRTAVNPFCFRQSENIHRLKIFNATFALTFNFRKYTEHFSERLKPINLLGI